jgi:hypothetical protein
MAQAPVRFTSRAVDARASRGDHPCAGDIVVYKGPAAEMYLVSVFQRASQMSFCTRDEAMHDAVACATKDHVDAWCTEDGQAYERMAAHRVQGRRAVS